MSRTYTLPSGSKVRVDSRCRFVAVIDPGPDSEVKPRVYKRSNDLKTLQKAARNVHCIYVDQAGEGKAYNPMTERWEAAR